ncbi:MAG: hypothetical protein HUU57_16685 [Bdellovibrio sp.]|nr:hypothetical protein [Bdellovibrio sp.]
MSLLRKPSLKLALKSLLLISSIPLLAFALEPVNPENLCSRFIGDDDIKNCEQRTQKETIDWYAASVCNLQKDDTAFWTCWDSLKDKKIQPRSLSSCVGDDTMSDDQRHTCLNKLSSSAGRAPAALKSSDIFQPLKVKGR